MLNPTKDDIRLIDDGTLDTVLAIGDEEFRFSHPEAAAESRDMETAEVVVTDVASLIEDNFDDMRDTMYERFFEYGLSFDYVEPGTFTDQDEGYLRYQISWGGPSEEIRFYVSPHNGNQVGEYWFNEWHLHRAEFWYLDWFDGASVDVTRNETVRTLFNWFNECDAITSAIRIAGNHDE